MNQRAVELGRLYVAREQIDALIDAAERELALEPSAPVCEHPEEKRKYDSGTMGAPPRFTCQQCGVTVAEVQDPNAILSRVVRAGSSPEGA